VGHVKDNDLQNFYFSQTAGESFRYIMDDMDACVYSWTPIIQTQLFRIPCYFELKTISLWFSLPSFPISYFELTLFWTIFRFPCEFEKVGFKCICKICTYKLRMRSLLISEPHCTCPLVRQKRPGLWNQLTVLTSISICSVNLERVQGF